MSPRSRVLVLAASIAGVLAAGSAAVGQGSSTPAQPGATAEAKLAWAKRHVELVCRPLEAQKMFDRATRCYNDVARLMGVSSRDETPAATAERREPAAKPAAESAPAAAPVTPAKTRPSARPAPVRTAAARPAPVRTAAAPARVHAPARTITVAQTERQAAPVFASASGRCSGVSCLRYTLLGVGF